MEQNDTTDLLRINVQLACAAAGRCEDCHAFFECVHPHKQNFLHDRGLKSIAANLSSVKHIIAVMSGKGGVGKSIISANLAVALSGKGYAVAIMDSDIYGPSIPSILGMEGQKLQWGPKGIVPLRGPLGIKIVSMGFLLSDESAVTWLNDDKKRTQELFLANTHYGSLDYLIIDMPPGTGSETVTLLKYLPQLSGALIVTVPTDVAERVVHRCISLCRKAKTPVLGLIENMSSVSCPQCGETYALKRSPGDALAAESGVSLLGKIARDPEIVNAADAGSSFLLTHPDSQASRNFLSIVDRLEEKIGIIPKENVSLHQGASESRLSEIVEINVSLSACNRGCWSCPKYFRCTHAERHDLRQSEAFKNAAKALAGVKHKIAVMSCKGGVGKSTFAANLAVALAQKGKKIAVFDCDFHGPSIPKILGMEGRGLKISRKGIKPASGLLDIGVVSVDYVIQQGEAVTWFDELKKVTVEWLLGGIDYGNLDYLIVDLPPGTGGESSALLQITPDLDGIIIMTLPSENSQTVARRSINLCRQAGARVIGIVENMSSFVCPHCNGVFKMCGTREATTLAAKLGVPYLGDIPLDIGVSASCDEGTPFVIRYPDSIAAHCIVNIAGKLEEFVERAHTLNAK